LDGENPRPDARTESNADAVFHVDFRERIAASPSGSAGLDVQH
jgi:hypothetical protein